MNPIHARPHTTLSNVALARSGCNFRLTTCSRRCCRGGCLRFGSARKVLSRACCVIVASCAAIRCSCCRHLDLWCSLNSMFGALHSAAVCQLHAAVAAVTYGMPFCCARYAHIPSHEASVVYRFCRAASAGLLQDYSCCTVPARVLVCNSPRCATQLS